MIISIETRWGRKMTADWEKSFWRRHETDAEHQERVDHAEKEANRYFKEATAPALREFRDTLIVIEPYRGAPKFDRLLAEAKAKYAADVREAAELFEITAAEVMETGEVSEATGERWDALMKLEAVRDAMRESFPSQGAHSA